MPNCQRKKSCARRESANTSNTNAFICRIPKRAKQQNKNRKRALYLVRQDTGNTNRQHHSRAFPKQVDRERIRPRHATVPFRKPSVTNVHNARIVWKQSRFSGQTCNPSRQVRNIGRINKAYISSWIERCRFRNAWVSGLPVNVWVMAFRPLTNQNEKDKKKTNRIHERERAYTDTNRKRRDLPRSWEHCRVKSKTSAPRLDR